MVNISTMKHTKPPAAGRRPANDRGCVAAIYTGPGFHTTAPSAQSTTVPSTWRATAILCC
ncbi:hypothetical protein Kim5_CH03666 [Rhizobium sp. Kim5]|nr:hypothetical protein Kim5_CH03666 [Rhizobium sp. Kim5]